MGGIVIILLALVFLPKSPLDVQILSTIQDTPQIDHNVSVDINPNLIELATVKDIAAINQDGDQVDSDFYVDENGTKHYTIVVKDVPTFKITHYNIIRFDNNS